MELGLALTLLAIGIQLSIPSNRYAYLLIRKTWYPATGSSVQAYDPSVCTRVATPSEYKALGMRFGRGVPALYRMIMKYIF